MQGLIDKTPLRLRIAAPKNEDDGSAKSIDGLKGRVCKRFPAVVSVRTRLTVTNCQHRIEKQDPLSSPSPQGASLESRNIYVPLKLDVDVL